MRTKGFSTFTVPVAQLLAGKVPVERELMLWVYLRRQHELWLQWSVDAVAWGNLSAFSVEVTQDIHEGVVTHLAKLVLQALVGERNRFAAFLSWLGVTSIGDEFRVNARVPAAWPLGFLSHLKGQPMKWEGGKVDQVWLRRLPGTLRIEVRLILSWGRYRGNEVHSLAQTAGERLEVFSQRVWEWLESGIKWRMPQPWYQQFFSGEHGMKRYTLRGDMHGHREAVKQLDAWECVFSWGRGADPCWADEMVERQLDRSDGQYSTARKIEMTGARVAVLKRWIARDKANRTIADKKRRR